MLHEDMRKFFGGFPRDAHPMAILSASVSALSTFYQDSLDPTDPRQVEISIHRLLAKLPTIAAYSYKKSIGQPFVYPQNDLSYTANFLQMMFAVPCEPYEVDPDAVAALNLLLDRARRPRAELLDQHGADGRLVERQPVRQHLGRHLRLVGAAARRGERGRAC